MSPGPVGAGRFTLGVARTVGRTVAGATLDVSNGLLRAGEAAGRRLAGSEVGPAGLRVRVLILSDEAGRPVCSPDAVAPAVATADRVFAEQAGIRVRLTSTRVIDLPAPPQALDARADRNLLLDDLVGRTAFYTDHAPNRLDPVGAPLTVVVIRSIAGRTTGCSLGISADWVIVRASLFDRGDPSTYDETVVAHELGHALNLPHRRSERNLMSPTSSPPDKVRGVELERWQVALLHANRHVVPGVAAGPSAP